MNIFPTPTKQELHKLEFDMWIIHNTLHEEETIMVDKYPNMKQIYTGYEEQTMNDVRYFEGENANDDFYEYFKLDYNNVILTEIIYSEDEKAISLAIDGQAYHLELF